MQYLLVLAFLILSLKVNANCEYNSEGYHTIAGYAKSDEIKDKKYLFYYFIDPYWYFNTINNENNQLSLIELKHGDLADVLFENKACSNSVKIERVDKFLRVPACKNVVLNEHSQLRGFAILDAKKILIPRYYRGDLAAINTDYEKKTSQSIEAYLKRSDFWASQTQVIVPKEMKIKSIEFLHFNSIFSSSTVEVEIGEKGSFFVVFLIAKDQLWPIADSSGLTKCDEEPDLTKHRKDFKAFVDEGWDFNGDLIPDLIRFKGINIYYHIDFGKEMLVLKDMTESLIMRHNQDHGLKPKK